MPVARAAFVTGAAAGLARGIVLDLARAGRRVAFTYRSGGTPPDETLALLRAERLDAVAVPADHAVAGETARAAAVAADAVGELAILVHAVGPMVARGFARSSAEDARAMLAGNLESAVEAAFAVLPAMRAAGFGRVVYFGMNGSTVTRPERGLSLYGAAKAGVVAFARTLALEEARHGISVNVVEPGDIRDKAAPRAGALLTAANNPTGHAGSWEDVALAVRFLTADDAGYINGVTIAVSGGRQEAHE